MRKLFTFILHIHYFNSIANFYNLFYKLSGPQEKTVHESLSQQHINDEEHITICALSFIQIFIQLFLIKKTLMIIKSISQAYYRFWYRFLKIQKKVCGSKSITEKRFKGFKTLKTKCFNQNLSDLLKKTSLLEHQGRN